MLIATRVAGRLGHHRAAGMVRIGVNGVWTLMVSVATIIGSASRYMDINKQFTASFFITVWQPFHLSQTVEVFPGV